MDNFFEYMNSAFEAKNRKALIRGDVEFTKSQVIPLEVTQKYIIQETMKKISGLV